MTHFILSIAVTWGVANVMKPVVTLLREKKINRKTIATNGGMPSGHTSLVVSLSTALFLETGLSPAFFTGVVLAIIVMYDAVMIRTEIEKQARVLNRLLAAQGIADRMEETVGHTPAEVLVSLGMGILIPIIIYSVL
jgi:acid phosphatase family membrane protein YuiD